MKRRPELSVAAIIGRGSFRVLTGVTLGAMAVVVVAMLLFV